MDILFSYFIKPSESEQERTKPKAADDEIKLCVGVSESGKVCNKSIMLNAHKCICEVEGARAGKADMVCSFPPSSAALLLLLLNAICSS